MLNSSQLLAVSESFRRFSKCSAPRRQSTPSEWQRKEATVVRFETETEKVRVSIFFFFEFSLGGGGGGVFFFFFWFFGPPPPPPAPFATFKKRQTEKKNTYHSASRGCS